MNSLGERLREARTNKDLTQDDVASRLGVTRSVIARYESNTNDPPSENLKKLAEIYDVSTDWLLGITNVMGSPPQSDDSVYAAHRDDGYDKPLDPETLAYINKAVEEAFKKREEWLKKRNKPNKGK